uniref:Ground-like domain-containing protein n=1 Tax=Panagrolaimus sp. ES5 TaxID=591445 RepID=A0AC34GET4_9BILA
MQKLTLFCFIGLIAGASCFLFPGGSGGGGGCGCCPPPAPACPPPSCGGGCAKARAKGAKNTVPTAADDMELRAQLAGFNLDDPSHVDTESTQLKYFEKLGEEQQQADQIPEVVVAIEKAKNSKTSRFAPRPQDDAPAAAVMVESTDAPAAPAVKVSDSTAAPEVVPTRTSSEVTSAESEAEQTSKCNSDALKQLMLENITENSSESKHTINAIAEKKFAGPIDVICSRGHFSYVYSSNLYCEATKGEVTCIAFRQSV